MKIFGIDNSELLDVKVTSSAVHEEEMMKSDFVRLSWKGNVKATLAVGTYIVPFGDGLKYRLIEPYEPQQDAEDTFTYQPEFQHPKMWLSKVPFTYATKNTLGDDVVQQEWEYTGQTVTLLQMVVDFINSAFGFAESEKFKLTVEGSIDTNVSVSFSSTDVLSAISSIASACSQNKCEWHLSWAHKALYFGQVSVNLEEAVPTLKVGENVGKASVSESKDGYYNVFFPQGSTRNMSVRAASGENVSTGIRLGLDKAKYPDGEIDTRTDTNEPKQTLALTFDDIYPHVDCYAYNVRKRTRYLLDDNDERVVSSYNADGSVKEYKKYTVWYMRLAYPLSEDKGNSIGQYDGYYWYDYVVDDSQIIDGYTLCGSFKANTSQGALASSLVAQPSGSDGFELIFHKTAQTISPNEATGDSGVSVLAGDFEIVFVNQNGTVIPTNEAEGMIPRGEARPSTKGNIVILYNIAMGDDEVAAAQDELEKAVKEEIEYRHSDRNNYTFSAYPNVWAKSNPNLYIGQRVVYDDGNGYSYTTRVMKLVTNLDYDIVQEITVGNAEIKGSVSQLKEDVQGLINGTVSVGSGLSYDQVLNIVKNYTGQRYLSRAKDDTAQGLITFLKGILLGGDGSYGISETGAATLLSLLVGGKYGITKDGVGTLAKLVADTMQTSGYTSPDMHGQGAAMYQQGGLGYMVTDYLTVRLKAVFQELEIRELNYVAGNYIFSHAGGTIISEEELQGTGLSPVTEVKEDDTVTGWKVYFKADDGETRVKNMWRAGDQALCQTFNIDSPGTYKNVSNRYYWRLVTESGTEEVTFTKQDGTTEKRQLVYIVLSDRDIFSGAIGKDKDVYAEGYDGTNADTSIWIGRDPLTRGGSSDKASADYEQYRTASDTMLKLKGVTSGFANDAPAAGDKLGQAGCQALGLVKERGGMVEIVTEGIGAEPVPAINVYASMNSYRWSPYKVIQISPDGIIGVAKYFSLTTNSTAGDPVRNFNYRGYWASDIEYDYYDSVTHDGLLWLCTSEDGSKGDEPGIFSEVWTCVSDGGNELRIEFESDKGNVVYVDNVDLTLTAHLMFGQKNYDGILLQSVNNLAWTRDSGDEAADKSWTPTVGDTRNVLKISHHNPSTSSADRRDCGTEWESRLFCSFTFTATIYPNGDISKSAVTASAKVNIGNKDNQP